jgi:hypothetical protein
MIAVLPQKGQRHLSANGIVDGFKHLKEARRITALGRQSPTCRCQSPCTLAYPLLAMCRPSLSGKCSLPVARIAERANIGRAKARAAIRLAEGQLLVHVTNLCGHYDKNFSRFPRTDRRRGNARPEARDRQPGRHVPLLSNAKAPDFPDFFGIFPSRFLAGLLLSPQRRRLAHELGRVLTKSQLAAAI